MLCLRVNNESGAYSTDQHKFWFDESSQKFHIDNDTVNICAPIGIQLFNNYMYIYLNNQTIIAVSDSKFNELSKTLRTYRIPSLKIPNKQTQQAASLQQSKQDNVFVHCGTLDFDHDCFIVARFDKNRQIQIKDKDNNSILKYKYLNQNNNIQILFNDQQKRISLGFQNFYFWKQLEYLDFKYRILNTQPINCMDEEVVRDRSVQQYQYNEAQKVQQQQIVNEKQEVNQKVSRQVMEQQHVENNEKKIQNVEMQIQNEQRLKTQKKPIKQHEQMTTGRKNPQRMQQQGNEDNKQDQMNNEDETIKKRLRYSTLHKNISYNPRRSQYRDKSSKIDQQNNQNQIQDMNQVDAEQNNQKLYQFNTQICCLYESNVLDIKQKNGQRYLYYHKFQGVTQLEAKPHQLCNLKHFIEEDNYEHVIRPTKLLFGVQSKSAYYNDQNREYIHSYDVHKNRQQHHSVKYPVVDMVRHKSSCILGIHSNIIFQFDTRQKSKHQIQRYKTVHDLSKITGVFQKFYYATASCDGSVRTYDIRNHIKALNKFQMEPGITSLQLSDEGSYILCRYGNKSQILSCYDKNDTSVFQSRVLKSDRRQSKNLVKGYQNLSHIQFIHGNETEGDIMAVDDQHPCNLVIKNIQLSTSIRSFPLKYGNKQIEYLDCFKKWVIYGKQGTYYRQQAPWFIKN